ncbi:HNH endonuclease [Micromonospora sp. DH14]|uniref:HNH endonuclease n=1 Tax=Micromonospora sp. DH14 TaxID=3040120 RepID=UPI002440F1A9|nr:HNH endonuclease [Micromonospora sp. DH14]MDG9675177.1 HNH endonuclease [Micromonospora sp. DH14]
MPDTLSDPLSGFSPARPYTRDAAGDAPQTPGVHVVIENGEVVYVGSTGDLRRRLRQHLTGNRGSSVLHDQVGRLLDQRGAPAAAADIANWLAHCDLRWLRTDDARGVKEALVATLGPRFNRHVPKEARLPEVSAQVLNVDDLVNSPDGRRSIEPEAAAEGRRRRLVEVTARQGQADFRRRLMEAYGNRCAITGCDTEAALQAAHIDPYDGPATNQVNNGLLLRADLHNLLDRGLIWIDESYVLHVVGGTEHYSGYHGQRIRLPRRIEDLPDPEALLRHRRDVACIL